MIEAMLRLVFRCPHRQITRPITPLDRSGIARSGTYVVCIDCGTQMPYDWDHMRLVRQGRRNRAADARRPEWAKEANRRE